MGMEEREREREREIMHKGDRKEEAKMMNSIKLAVPQPPSSSSASGMYPGCAMSSHEEMPIYICVHTYVRMDEWMNKWMYVFRIHASLCIYGRKRNERKKTFKSAQSPTQSLADPIIRSLPIVNRTTFLHGVNILENSPL